MDWQKCNSLFIVVVVVVALALVVITRDMLSKAIKTIVAKQLTMPSLSTSPSPSAGLATIAWHGHLTATSFIAVFAFSKVFSTNNIFH